MSASRDGYIRAHMALPVTLNLPNGEIVTGLLVGTMHDRGAVLHHRVCAGEGLFYLAPPHWVVQAEAVA